MGAIRDGRIKMGWTQEELAYRMGLDVGTISRWETGKQYPKIAFARQLAQVLGCDWMSIYDIGVQRSGHFE